MKFTLTAVAAVLLVQCALGMNATDRRFSCRCGRRNQAMRIIGGTKAGRAEFPWQAHLYGWRSNRNYFSFCGGSIISSRLILTAAHCFFDGRGGRTQVRRYTVSVGTNKAFDIPKMVEVDDVTIHEGYIDGRAGSGNNDIAMMVLKEPLEFSHDVSPICLPQARTSYSGKTGIVSGWGRLSQDGRQPTMLQKVNLPILSESSCRSKWPYYKPFDPATEICVNAPIGKDPCKGDSGGPLVAFHRGHYDLVGVVSFGSTECGNQLISVFAKVQGFLPWINNFLRGRDGGRTCRK